MNGNAVKGSQKKQSPFQRGTFSTLVSSRVSWFMVATVCASLLCACVPSVGQSPKAVNGVLDLRGWNWAEKGTVKLDGEWEFYWDHSFRSLADHPAGRDLQEVPGPWTNKHPQRGKATYRLKILTSPEACVYGIKLYEFPQSYRMYVDGKFLVETGKYSETPELSSRSLVRPYSAFAHEGGALVLTIEAVNLDEEEPGPRRSIVFGLEKDVRSVQDGQLISDMVVCGVLAIMAAYHLGLYFQRRREVGSLLFGLFCSVMVFRISVTEEHYLHKYFPSFPSDIEQFLDVFSFFILTPTMSWIFKNFFAEEFRTWVAHTATIVFVILSLVFLISPSKPVFQIYGAFTLIIGLYLAYVLFLGIIRKRPGSIVFLFGFLLFAGTSIWDLLSLANVIRATYVSHIGFVFFILSQAYFLSIRFNRALFTAEELTVNLEALVAERTSALEESNRKLEAMTLTDALTGIPNRRRFDEMLRHEWERAKRLGQPVSLAMIDVDHFKKYNDQYGHQGGDECLRTVAGVLLGKDSSGLAARYGGEEFGLIWPRCKGTDALHLAEELRHQVESLRIPHTGSPVGHVTMSIGLASAVPGEADDAGGLIKLADEALYRAKQLGRNRVVLLDQRVSHS